MRSVKAVSKYQCASPTYLGSMLTLYSGGLNRACIYINHKQQLEPHLSPFGLTRYVRFPTEKKLCQAFCSSQSHVTDFTPLSDLSLSYFPSFLFYNVIFELTFVSSGASSRLWKTPCWYLFFPTEIVLVEGVLHFVQRFELLILKGGIRWDTMKAKHLFEFSSFVIWVYKWWSVTCIMSVLRWFWSSEFQSHLVSGWINDIILKAWLLFCSVFGFC